MGGRVGRGRIRRVRGEPVAGGAVSGTARRLRRQERSGQPRTSWPTWCVPTPPGCGPLPADSAAAEAVKVVARAHKTLIWERTRHTLRLRTRCANTFRPRWRPLRPRRARHAGTARQSARSGVGGEVDPQPDPGRAQTRPPPRYRYQDHPYPGRAARRSAGPRRGDHHRLRGHHPRRGRGAGHPRRADQDAARAGRGAFWPASGR